MTGEQMWRAFAAARGVEGARYDVWAFGGDPDGLARLALDGGADGLHCYREIIRQSPRYLKPGGMLYLEIGYDQAEAVTGLMEQDFTGIRVVEDLAGLCRVVYGSRKP